MHPADGFSLGSSRGPPSNKFLQLSFLDASHGNFLELSNVLVFLHFRIRKKVLKSLK